MKPKIYVPIVAAIIIIAAVYFVFLRGDAELDKVIKSLNAQNYEMAVGKLKEILYDDEENIEAKGLLLYAQTRKIFDEQGIKTFDKAMRVSFPNLISVYNLSYQNKLNELGYLKSIDREQFLNKSKDFRQQLAKYGITTQDMNELEELLRRLCEVGSQKMRLSQGDEVDQALYAFLLAGNSFFGDKESGTNLLKLARTNDKVMPLFNLCGEAFIEDLKKELLNDETLFGDYAKYLVIKSLVQEEIKNLTEKYPKMQSAKDYLSETNNSLSNYLMVDYRNDQIFYGKKIFETYLNILEQNAKAGIDVKVNLFKDNNIICLYFYNTNGKQFISKFYSFLDNSLMPINFKNKNSTKYEFLNENTPMRFYSYNNENNQLTIVIDKIEKKTGHRTEQRWNAQKYYNSWGYQGGYDIVSVPYEYEDINNIGSTYTLNKDKADYVSDYPSTNDKNIEEEYEGD